VEGIIASLQSRGISISSNEGNYYAISCSFWYLNDNVFFNLGIARLCLNTLKEVMEIKAMISNTNPISGESFAELSTILPLKDKESYDAFVISLEDIEQRSKVVSFETIFFE
jgi:hypothetical protein